jgi:hypothetical protein
MCDVEQAGGAAHRVVLGDDAGVRTGISSPRTREARVRGAVQP